MSVWSQSFCFTFATTISTIETIANLKVLQNHLVGYKIDHYNLPPILEFLIKNGTEPEDLYF